MSRLFCRIGQRASIVLVPVLMLVGMLMLVGVFMGVAIVGVHMGMDVTMVVGVHMAVPVLAMRMLMRMLGIGMVMVMGAAVFMGVSGFLHHLLIFRLFLGAAAAAVAHKSPSGLMMNS